MFYQFNEIPEHKGNNLIKKYPHDAGWDIRSGQATVLYPRTSEVLSTGLHIVIPAGFKGVIQSRSGMAMNYTIEASNAGVIDHGYMGEVKVRLYNHSAKAMQILIGDKVAQIVFDFSLTVPVRKLLDICAPHFFPELNEDAFSAFQSDRGDKGFGHTGVA
jgi:deoxyuridine 5'-triphosphate nucleotidohydrolase